MTTLLISDLHLGSLSGSDLLRDAELRAPLLELAAEADRIVLLGDVLELRHGPAREALAASREFFEDLGRALAHGEVIVVAGNHDHGLLEPWLARRGEQDGSEPLDVEQLIAPAAASPMLERIAEWLSPARVQAAYPGLWVRDDTYATHGHYLDCHLTVPTLERLSVGAMSRLLGRPASGFSSVEEYEAVTAPVYVWRDAVAREFHTGDALNGNATLRAWRALGGSSNSSSDSSADRRRGGELARRVRTRALVAAFPLAVAALNRAGLGPLRAVISGTELRRAGLRAMGEVAARLGLGEAYVVFGHTHRAGPLARDDQSEWRGGGVPAPGAPRGASMNGDGSGARLINAGCWTFDTVFLTQTPGESPYWPGTCVVVEDSGPPRLERLLVDRSHEQLRSARRELRARPA
jgi:Calcineurin-like phosphoesterase superfamily domain